MNRAPVVSSFSTNTLEDLPLRFTLQATDPDGDPLVYTVNWVNQGTVSLEGSNVIYYPPVDFAGQDTFYFIVSDGLEGGEMEGTIELTIDPVNDAPFAYVFPCPVYEDIASDIYVLGSDVENDPLTFRVTHPPVHGSVVPSDGGFVYISEGDYNGPDSFSFVANDGQLDSAPVLVSLDVMPTLDAPVATPMEIVLSEDCSTNIVLAGMDVDGDALTFVTDGVLHGTLVDNGTNVIFTPEPNFNGEASFLFQAFDGFSYSSYAEVRILVTPVNDAPVSLPQSVTTAYNCPAAITLTGSDVEGAALGFTVLTDPAKGVLSGIAPNLVFTPNIGATGTTSFTFKTTDGVMESSPASISVTIQAPAAVPATPTGLRAITASRSQINLTWTDASTNEDGFKIERSTNGSTWTQVGSAGPDVRSYTSTGLTANRTYYFRIRAFNVVGNSAYSGTVSAKTAK